VLFKDFEKIGGGAHAHADFLESGGTRKWW